MDAINMQRLKRGLLGLGLACIAIVLVTGGYLLGKIEPRGTWEPSQHVVANVARIDRYSPFDTAPRWIMRSQLQDDVCLAGQP